MYGLVTSALLISTISGYTNLFDSISPEFKSSVNMSYKDLHVRFNVLKLIVLVAYLVSLLSFGVLSFSSFASLMLEMELLLHTVTACASRISRNKYYSQMMFFIPLVFYGISFVNINFAFMIMIVYRFIFILQYYGIVDHLFKDDRRSVEQMIDDLPKF